MNLEIVACNKQLHSRSESKARRARQLPTISSNLTEYGGDVRKIILFAIMLCSICLFADGVQPFGSGTETDPFQIESLDNLLWLSTTSEYWGSEEITFFYIQTSDIDASETQNWNDGAGFKPIGEFTPSPWVYEPFQSVYNGQGYIIDSLYINTPGMMVQNGLFGFTYFATIENLGLTNVNITGGSIGGIVSLSQYSSINNCYCTGSLNTTSHFCGGIVGEHLNSTLTSCYSNCDITGYMCCGGLIGKSSYSTIMNCYSSGSVGGDYFCGGVIGGNENPSTVSDSYSTCNVAGTSFIGGFVGSAYTPLTVMNCYSIGNVTGSGCQIGGFAGDFSGIALNSFWCIETSSQSQSACGTGKTISEMHDVATYTSLTTIGLDDPWDFVGNPFDDIGNEDYWDIEYLINDGYPFLTTAPVVSTDDEEITEIFSASKLIGNYPNPFNPTTTIEFSISNDSKIKLTIYNIKGQKITTLANNDFSKGKHSLIWNGKDEYGKPVSSGIYCYKLKINGKTKAVKKCLLLK